MYCVLYQTTFHLGQVQILCELKATLKVLLGIFPSVHSGH